MPIACETSEPNDRELMLTALLDAPRAAVWRCWTEPELLMQWFTPAPWKTVRAEIDVRPGGSSLVVMQSPDGEEYPNPGIYLEVVEGEKLVTTDAFTAAWQPSAKPFMTAVVTFADEDGKTRYTARALHWTAEDTKAHAEMGFHEGWAAATAQLEAAAQAVARGETA